MCVYSSVLFFSLLWGPKIILMFSRENLNKLSKWNENNSISQISGISVGNSPMGITVGNGWVGLMVTPDPFSATQNSPNHMACSQWHKAFARFIWERFAEKFFVNSPSSMRKVCMEPQRTMFDWRLRQLKNSRGALEYPPDIITVIRMARCEISSLKAK